MLLDTFDIPPCVALAELKAIRRRLRQSKRQPSAEPPPAPLPSSVQPGAVPIWDGPAYLAATGQVDQASVPVPVAVSNLGRTYTARGLTATNYYEFAFAVVPSGVTQLLPGNPSRRMVAIAFTGIQTINYGWGPDQLTTMFLQAGSSGNSPFVLFDDESWGAWVTYPVWVNVPTSGGCTVGLWEEVYLSYKAPTLG